MSRALFPPAWLEASVRLAGCGGDPAPPQSPQLTLPSYTAWNEMDAEQRIYPGEKLKIDVRTAPELNAEAQVEPAVAASPCLLSGR